MVVGGEEDTEGVRVGVVVIVVLVWRGFTGIVGCGVLGWLIV